MISRLISAVPSTSAGLVYGRAALLGYTAGESRCEGAYPKCPRNEVFKLLSYFNNSWIQYFFFKLGQFTLLPKQSPWWIFPILQWWHSLRRCCRQQF